MRIIIDIDGTLCTQNGKDYLSAKPIQKRIDKVNKLYSLGHKIILWTARGSTSGIDWRKDTEKQLQDWGVQYNELMFGKPHYDVWFDDKAMTTEAIEFFK